MAAAAAVEREVELSAEMAAGPTDLSVDRLRLEQTLLNIVLNAVQACAEGGQVVVRAENNQDGGFDFRVEDSGSGIDATTLKQVFEPFFTTKIDGTGLGLANARKIVEEHHGFIQVENRPQGGALFVVHLPPERLYLREA
jgi:signal transduction histidine kinase